ncbi:MAG: peptidase S9 [Candidatus Aminicenantes bacterium RBG_13_63_10]|nr:MAG: peptidase S9 [Candidatus Aminicenantes bacterium RBG_13_63_10]
MYDLRLENRRAARTGAVALLLSVFLLSTASWAQQEDSAELKYVKRAFSALEHRLDEIEKSIDDVLWFDRVGDVAYVDKVRIVGPPRWREPNPTAQGAGNPVKFYCYVFIPRDVAPGKKYPLLVLPHGGVHANFDTYHTHLIREMTAQGYIVAAPDYRGSTGYGRGMVELIDYGGLENEDVLAARNFVLENYRFADKDRVGIVGWSHGGMIALMNIFKYPDAYQVAFAGVPVSDLVARMGYKGDDYRALYSAPYHLGKTAEADVQEYRRRSPVLHVDKLRTPLLIHGNTNDEDVNVLEVEHLVQALKAAGKKFEYEIFQDAPGGHSFDRLDILPAKQIRLKIYAFLARHLNPPRPFRSLQDLQTAGYAGNR